ncbi:MAG: hypothetical protein NUV57_00160 [archaeon]|nr:hypothetical protein [archaeon]
MHKPNKPANLYTPAAKKVDEYLANPQNKRAVTLKEGKSFNPFYSVSPVFGASKKKSQLFLKGMHQLIESYMIDHPGQRVPSTEIAKKFGCERNTVIGIARKIGASHGHPKRVQGGANMTLTPKAYEIIHTSYKNTQPGGKVNLWNVIKEIAMTTGEVVSVSSVTKHIKIHEKNENKGIGLTVGHKGLFTFSIADIQEALRKEGIRFLTAKRGRADREAELAALTHIKELLTLSPDELREYLHQQKQKKSK